MPTVQDPSLATTKVEVAKKSPNSMEVLLEQVDLLSASVIEILHTAGRCHQALLGGLSNPPSPREEDGPLEVGSLLMLTSTLRKIQVFAVEAQETLNAIEEQVS